MINYRKQISSLISGQILGLLLGIVLPLLLVRELSLEDYGNYAKVILLIGTASSIFAFGVSSELYYFYPIAPQNKRGIFIIQSFLLLLVLGGISIIFSHIPIIQRFLFKDDFLRDNINLICVCIFFAIPEKIIQVLYLLNHDYKLSRIYLPISTVLRVFLIIIFYYINMTIQSILYAILITYIIQFLLTVIYTLKTYRKDSSKYILFDNNLFKTQIKYILPFGLASSVRLLSESIDKIIILSFVSPSVYAIYSIAFYGIPGLPQLYLSITQGYIPRMSEASAKNKTDEIVALYKSMVSKTLSYTIPLVLIVIYFADVIIPVVFSSKYIESINYFRIYLLTFIIVAFGFGNIIRATGETSKTLAVNLFSLVLGGALTYFLIKYYSLNGAIISAVLNILVPKILLLYYDIKTLNITLSKLLPFDFIFKIVLTSVVSLFPIMLIRYFLNENLFINILLGIFYVILVVFFQLILNIFIIKREEVLLRWKKIQNYCSKYKTMFLF